MAQHPWESGEIDWDWSPISPHLIGDSGPWAWSVPFAWRALADPLGAWLPPIRPLPVEEYGHDVSGQRIAYWTPCVRI